MKRTALLLLFAALLVLPASAFGQTICPNGDVLLLGFTGFDYETDANGGVDPTIGVYLQVGDYYECVGYITSFDPTLLGPYTDFSVEEYTLFLTGLQVTLRSFNSGILVCQFADHGRVRYYSDLIAGGTPADYGIFPRNATAPSTFTDGDGTGTMQLGGDVNQFLLTYNFNNNAGSWTGVVDLDEGPYLSYIPVNQRSGWVLGAQAGAPNPTIPSGYENQISGECRLCLPTPTTRGTWGALKALYR